MFISRAAAQKVERVLQAIMPTAGHTGGISAGTVILGGQ
jgi:hypothetical protein